MGWERHLRTASRARDLFRSAIGSRRPARRRIAAGAYTGFVVLVLARRVVARKTGRLERLAVQPVEGRRGVDPVQRRRGEARCGRGEARGERAERHGCFPRAQLAGR